MNVRASTGALALVVLSLAATAAHGRHAGHAPVSPPHPLAARTAPGLHQATLPDTVLARLVFSTGQTNLTATNYRTTVIKFAANPDTLAPAARREVLGMMIQQAVLDHRVGQAPPRWLHRDSTNFDDFRDGLVLRAALDSALAELGSRFAARGDTIPNHNTLMVMVRDSALATLHVVYDEPAIDSVAAAFAALPEDDYSLPAARRREVLLELPQVSPGVGARVLGRCDVGTFTANDLLAANAATGILRRPPLRKPRQVRSLVDDNLYTMLLRREARRQRIEDRPGIAAQLAVRRQFLTVQRFVQNEVYDRVLVDTATVRRYFDRDPHHYDLGATAQIVCVLSAGRSGVTAFRWWGIR